jgi:hypothetical protein
MVYSVRQKEIVRGKILSYLALIYPKPAMPSLLQGELDIFGYPVAMEELDFHVAYLAEKGFLSLTKQRGPKSAREITLVRITALGIDYHDGRLAHDEGVYLEPKS